MVCLDVSLRSVSVIVISVFPHFVLLNLALMAFCTILARVVCMICLYRRRLAVDLYVCGLLLWVSSTIGLGATVRGLRGVNEVRCLNP